MTKTLTKLDLLKLKLSYTDYILTQTKLKDHNVTLNQQFSVSNQDFLKSKLTKKAHLIVFSMLDLSFKAAGSEHSGGCGDVNRANCMIQVLQGPWVSKTFY